MYRDLGDLFKLKEVARSPWNYPGSDPLPWAMDIFKLDSYVVNFFLTSGQHEAGTGDPNLDFWLDF